MESINYIDLECAVWICLRVELLVMAFISPFFPMWEDGDLVLLPGNGMGSVRQLQFLKWIGFATRIRVSSRAASRVRCWGWRYKKCSESMAPGCSPDRDHVIIVWCTQTNAYGGYRMTGASWWASPVTIWTGPLNWPFLGPQITLSLGFITAPESWHWCFVIISLHCWQLSTSCNWI